MRTKHITIRKASGFQFSLTASIIDTPNGKIRTLEIIDHEVAMTDLLPSNAFILTFNDMDLNTNKSQIKELCEFMIEELTSQSKVKQKIKKR